MNLKELDANHKEQFGKAFDKGKFRKYILQTIKEREEKFYMDIIGSMGNKSLIELRDSLDGKKV